MLVIDEQRHRSAGPSGRIFRRLAGTAARARRHESMSTPRCRGSQRSSAKMLPHDALRMACFDRRGRPIVNASTADVPDMMPSDVDEVIVDDLRAGTPGASAAPRGMERLVGAGYRSALAVSTRAPEPLVHVAFWSKQPLAFNRTHVPLARRIAYHLGLGACRGEVGTMTHQIQRRPCAAGRRGRAARRRPSERGQPRAGRRRVGRMARGAAQGDAGGLDGHDRAGDRRVGDRQGSRGAVHPCRVRPQRAGRSWR